MQWELNRFLAQSSSSIYSAYIQDGHPIHALYHFHPHDEKNIERRIQFIDNDWQGVDRAHLVKVLTEFHKPELFSPAVERNLKRLLEPNSLVVIGGQQAGLFTGPLYTIYKAVTVIQLAKWAETKWNRPVVPVFWIAGEDHDWDEVDHVWLFDQHRAPVKLRYPKDPTNAKKPISEITFDPDQFHMWLREMADMLPDTIYKKEWHTLMKVMMDSSVTWTRFFARIMHHFFGEEGLLFVDSHDPNLRQLEVPFFRTLIQEDREITHVIKETEKKLKQLGFVSPAELKLDQSTIFLQREGKRQLLYRYHDRWLTQDGESWATDELLAKVEVMPECFSNNVLSRPLMQEFLFPTLFFVGGPGEIGYWSLLKQAFEVVGLKMPVIVPRWQATIIDIESQKQMQKWGIQWERDWCFLEDKRNEWLKRQETLDIEQIFQSWRKQWGEQHDSIVSTLYQGIGQNVQELGLKNKRKVMEQIDLFERWMKRVVAEKHRVELTQWSKIIHTVKPLGKPQERVWNLIGVWNAFGMDWLYEWLRKDVKENRLNGLHFQAMI